MSSIGSDFKRKIANAIANSINWEYGDVWLSRPPDVYVRDTDFKELGNGEFSLKVTTHRDGVYNFKIKVTEKL